MVLFQQEREATLPTRRSHKEWCSTSLLLRDLGKAVRLDDAEELATKLACIMR